MTKPFRFVSAVAMVCAFAWAGAAQADILIKNVTLYDGTGGPAVKGANILVKGERIAQVSTKAISGGSARVIDGTGKFVMPGIMDSHVHIKGGQRGSVFAGAERVPANDRDVALPTLRGFLYSGVTSVYDSGNNEPFIFPLRDDERAGKIISPRIFAAGGVITVPGGYGGGPTSLRVENWEQGKAGLDAKFAKKPDMLKMIKEEQGLYGSKAVPTLSDEMFKRITDYARQNGVRTTVHVSSEWQAQAAAVNGVSAMAHPVQRAVLNDSFVKLLADRKIPISTTLINYTQIARYGDADGVKFLDEPLFQAVMTEAERKEVVEEREGFVKIDLPATFKLGERYAIANAKRMFDEGVILTSGTDRGYGPFVHMELASLNKAGISAAALIKIATLNGAIYMGREKDLGSVEAGKYADILILKADPAADVKNFQAIDTVIKNGQRIDFAKLDLPVNHKK